MMEQRILIAVDEIGLQFPLASIKQKLMYEMLSFDVVQIQDIGICLRKVPYSLMLLYFDHDNGVNTVIQLRAATHILIIVISHTNDFRDQILYMRAGADDCFKKDIGNEDIFISRITCMVRRYVEYNSVRSKRNIIEYNGMLIAHKSRAVFVDNQRIPLTPTEYKILYYLAQNKGYVLTRKQIYEHIWRLDYDPENDPLDVYIHRIRTKIGSPPDSSKYIRNERGFGFRFG